MADNFVSNEVIVKGVTAAEIWPFLRHASVWRTYYNNASNIGFDGDAVQELKLATRFRFRTFGLDVEAEVTECRRRPRQRRRASRGAHG
jgi:hypothetical protein